MKTGAELILEERQRHLDQEGWTAHHDDCHPSGLLAMAGASYTLDAIGEPVAYEFWPFGEAWWKPTADGGEGTVKQLVKAGALIAAEIDKLQRRMHPDGQVQEIES